MLRCVSYLPRSSLGDVSFASGYESHARVIAGTRNALDGVTEVKVVDPSQVLPRMLVELWEVLFSYAILLGYDVSVK